MKSIRLLSHSPAETGALGERLGRLAQPGDVILLTGNLGAGKTCLTQGIARGLESPDHALSPTFTLVRELRGRLPLYHIDLYRLDNLAEIADLGLDEYLSGRGLAVVEWAEKGLNLLPAEHLLIKIDYLSDSERRLQLFAVGRRYEKLLSELKTRLCALSAQAGVQSPSSEKESVQSPPLQNRRSRMSGANREGD